MAGTRQDDWGGVLISSAGVLHAGQAVPVVVGVSDMSAEQLRAAVDVLRTRFRIWIDTVQSE